MSFVFWIVSYIFSFKTACFSIRIAVGKAKLLGNNLVLLFVFYLIDHSEVVRLKTIVLPEGGNKHARSTDKKNPTADC